MTPHEYGPHGDYERGVKAEAEQQAIRLREWLVDPTYGTWVGARSSTCGVGPFRDVGAAGGHA